MLKFMVVLIASLSAGFAAAFGTFDAECSIKLDNEVVFNGPCSLYSDAEQTLFYKDNVIQGKLAYIARNGQAEVAIKKVFLPQIMSRTTPMNLIRGGNVISTPVGEVKRKGNCWSNPRVLICFKTTR
jgi:hypothetical protein